MYKVKKKKKEKKKRASDYRIHEDQDDPTIFCSAPGDVQDWKWNRKSKICTYNGIYYNEEPVWQKPEWIVRIFPFQIINVTKYHGVGKTYERVGKSSYSALKTKNCVKNGSCSSLVAMPTALPNVPPTATIRRTRSSIEIPLFILGGVGTLEALPASSCPAFIFLFVSWKL